MDGQIMIDRTPPGGIAKDMTDHVKCCGTARIVIRSVVVRCDDPYISKERSRVNSPIQSAMHQSVKLSSETTKRPKVPVELRRGSLTKVRLKTPTAVDEC